jgi:Leucine-rich repeat (LRR) protein
MRVLTSITEVDQLLAELAEPFPGLAASIDEIPLDADAARISAKTRGLGALPTRRQLRRVSAHGVGERELQHIGLAAGLRQLQLYDSKVPDLRALAGLRALTTLRISVNARLASLDGIESLTNLQLVSTWSTPKLASIDALASLTDLRVLFLSGTMYGNIKLSSLKPLSNARRLVHLTLSGVRVKDRSLQPIAGLRSLQMVELPLHFPAEEFRMLERALPQARGQWRERWRQFGPRGART